jgi:phosphohistidine phosphatase
MQLYIVRHAWAFERNPARFPDDRLRPLEPNGVKRFRRVARRLVRRDVCPTWIATSPLVRCRQTAALLAQQVSNSTPIEELDALAPGSNLDEALSWTRQKFADIDNNRAQLAWVGHSPDVEELCARLIGDAGATIRFAKGAVASLWFADLPTIGSGRLDWLVTAKMLGC